MKLDELGRLLRRADPAAVLAPPQALDRLIQQTTGGSWVAWRVPHNRCHLVSRSTLFRYVEQEELVLPPDHLLPEMVLLLRRPTAEELAGPPADLLGVYWRLMFHVTLHRELSAALATVDDAGVRERVARIGPAAFEEARNVLTQDALLADGATDRETYIELAATVLELRYFAPNLIPVTFPSLPPVPEVERRLSQDVEPAVLFQKTRLEGAPDPDPKTDDQADESHDYYYRLSRGARRAAANGDTVGAAILHTRAARVAPAALTEPARDAARRDVFVLVDRLAGVFGLTDDEAENWRRVLPALLDKADQGVRPVEAALLFDLQRACQDHEQTPYALDVLEWAMSGGARPVMRPLAGQRFVRVPDHLRTAQRRLTAARLTDADRQALAGLLRDALDRSEDQLRRQFRPVLTEALRDAGLRPNSGPEQAALAKTVEELLDRISAAGFFTFADLRDAIARGQVKMGDLAGPDEYMNGDPLLRLDRRLSTLLDGVYRRGEVYTRLLERGTALAFGTQIGRWLTRNVALPFGGAFLLAQFVWLIEYERRSANLPSTEHEIETYEAVLSVAVHELLTELPFFSGWNETAWFHAAWVVLACAFLGLIRSPRLRHLTRAAGVTAYRTARRVFWDFPLRVWAHPVVRGVLQSGPALLAFNYLVKPIVVCAVVWLLFPPVWVAGPPARLGLFAIASLLVNTRVGAVGEAALTEMVGSGVRLFRVFPALIRWVMFFFQELVGTLEWLLARAEDWFRLRGGEGTISLGVRAVAGVIWSPVAFLIRLYMVVLIEPMLNPVKLPLSLLFAKFVYPLLTILGLFTLRPLSSPLVERIVGTEPAWPVFAVTWLLVVGTLYLLPDAVTYLFWEMRENWKLYRANRPAAVEAVVVGPHGETVGGLLHPGFHSGTVPKLFARLRAAERHGAETGEWADARENRQALRGVEEGVSRFVTRDLAAVLNPSPAWGGRKLAVGKVHLGTNRIRVELFLDGSPAPAVLEWEDRSGWLVAGWADPGWLPTLPPVPARTLANAMAYLYKRAGVDLIREHVRAELPSDAEHFDVTSAGLLVWYGSRETTPVLYDIAHRPDDLRPRTPDNYHPTAGPVLDADRLVFSRVRLTWPDWVAVWQAGATDQSPPRFGPDGFELVLLPAVEGDTRRAGRVFETRRLGAAAGLEDSTRPTNGVPPP